MTPEELESAIARRLPERAIVVTEKEHNKFFITMKLPGDRIRSVGFVCDWTEPSNEMLERRVDMAARVLTDPRG